MLRILVCIRELSQAEALYKRLYDIFKKAGATAELSYSVNADAFCKGDDSSQKDFDIYFIDSNDIRCIKLAARIRAKNLTPSIVFVNAKTEKLTELLKYRPSYALLPDSDISTIVSAVKWCYNEQMRTKPYFTVKNKDIQMRIGYDTISYFESRQRIVVMHTTNQVIEFYAKLGDVYTRLPKDMFVRCHQSYIVNMSRVRCLDKANRCFVMMSGTTIEISKSQYAVVLAEYEKYTE